MVWGTQGHTQQVYLRMSTTGRYLKCSLIQTSEISLRRVRRLRPRHILPPAPPPPWELPFVWRKAGLFLSGYFLRAEVSESTSAKLHWLCTRSFFMGCKLNLPHSWTSFCVDKQSTIKPWKPKRVTLEIRQVRGSWGLCNDDFVLYPPSPRPLPLEQNQQIYLSQNMYQTENILWMKTICTMLL